MQYAIRITERGIPDESLEIQKGKEKEAETLSESGGAYPTDLGEDVQCAMTQPSRG
ncbi:MAG: hypothetical protein M1587_10780 [Thaumarchaeota archaeon]|nr:hypothetical protein [Nitrososphaerota archaeon]